MNMRPRALGLAAAVAALVLTAAGCGGKQHDQHDQADKGAGGGRITIATGNTTGVYYQLGGGLGKLISDNIEGYRATATATGGSVQNIQGVVAGDYDIGFSLLDTAGDAVRGKGSFTTRQPVEALARLYPNYTQVVVRADSGIKSLADMKGKRISTGAPGSGTEVIAKRLLAAGGLDMNKDVRAQRLQLPETVDAMKDGTVDGLFWSGGVPTAGITDLTTTLGGKVRFLDITPQLSALRKEYGDVYRRGTIPASAYKQPGDIPTVIVPNVLLVKKGFDPELAKKITNVLFDHQSNLEQVNPAAKEISASDAPNTTPLPLNPGAKAALANRTVMA
ncbi:TAXI family TRAP transporter solute-binding subunit [Streptomyces sp. NBC_00829]|uniref:TAXI family TRAP transporter solute-binding subunit n=1 Tax=Streptomyces sp. NBC_00829 TaxID=2903679 RepID=UPI003865DDA9|nr:TAXI family TRAP transporter solute-binding subunit [Streptomyces sp. NBC_00829]